MLVSRSSSLAGLLLLLSSTVASGQAPHVVRVDLPTSGAAPDDEAYAPRISDDGDRVLFASRATNLVPSPAPGGGDVSLYVRHMRTGLVEQVNLDSTGQALEPHWVAFGLHEVSWECELSGDGRYVVFTTRDDDLLLGDSNGDLDVYRRDLLTGTTELVSVGHSGGTVAALSFAPQVSDDGSVVQFRSAGAGLVPGQEPSFGTYSRLFVRDLTTGTTAWVSTLGTTSGNNEVVTGHALSGDGRWSIFRRFENPLSPWLDELVRVDLTTLQTVPISQHALHPLALDRAGEVLVGTASDPLVPEDQDAVTDVYALEPLSDELTLVSDVGLPGWTTFEARSPRISPDGRYVAFRIGQVDGTLPEPLTGGQIFVVDRDTGQVLPGSLNDQAEFGGGSALPQQTPKDALGGDLSERGEHLVYATSYGNLVKPWTGERAIVRFDRRTAGPQLSVAGLVAGGTATLTVTDAAPGGVVLLGVSNGQGPVPSYWGPLYLSPPIHSLHVPTDVAGVASFAFPVSPTSVGTALYAQGLDVLAYEPTTPWYGVVD